MTPEDKALAEAWYSGVPIEIMAKSSGWSEARIREECVMRLKLGPRTISLRDQLSKGFGGGPVPDRRRELR